MDKYLVAMTNEDGTQYLSGDVWTHDSFDANRFDLDTADRLVRELKAEPSYGQCDAILGVHNARAVAAGVGLRTISHNTVDHGDDDGYGGSYTAYTVAQVTNGATDEEIDELVKDRFPSTFCQHEYDCCGNYYHGSAQWSRTTIRDYGFEDDTRPIIILIVQGASQNV